MTTTTPEIKLISRARYVLGPMYHGHPALDPEAQPENRAGSIMEAAVLEYNGLRLFSVIPKSAAEAAKINEALGG